MTRNGMCRGGSAHLAVLQHVGPADVGGGAVEWFKCRHCTAVWALMNGKKVY